MIIVGEVDISEIQRHEEATASNVRLGGYHMDRHSPANDFQCFRVLLESQDDDRVFLLSLTVFINQTQGLSGRLRDLVPAALAIEGVSSFTTMGTDLRTRAGWELVFVASELHSAPLVAIDGNHRAIAQYLTYGSMEGVPAYVCVHQAIGQWGYVPQLARTQTKHDSPGTTSDGKR